MRVLGPAAVVACGIIVHGPAFGQDVILDGPIPEPVGEPAIIDVAPDAEPIAPGELQGSVSLPEDATLRRRLQQAERLVESGRLDDAAQALGRLAESVGDSDVFVRSGSGRQSLRSFKTEVQRQIGALPAEGKAAYELAFGRAARRMLDDAPHDRATAERVATLYLHTEAGAEALYRVALHDRDRGSFAEAAACLERLLTLRPDAAARFEPHLSIQLADCLARSGDRPAAGVVLATLLRQPGTVHLAGDERSLDGSLAGLLNTVPTAAMRDGFTHHPGESDRPPGEAGEPFLVPCWSAELALSASEAEAINGGRGPGQTVPALFPTVTGDLVLLPTGGGFVALDRETGRRLWSYPSDGPGSPSAEAVWSRLADGRLSTDGRSVFLVETESAGGAANVVAPATPNVPIMQQAGPFVVLQGAFAVPADAGASSGTQTGPTNILSALDVMPPRQGNRLWTVGGVTGVDEPRLADHAFLGPPLAAHGRLYAIADHVGTTRLVVLDAATGRLDWPLDLGHAETPLANDPQRFRIGATPTLSRGVLFCPTAGGALVAVDLAGRSLLWGFRYPRSTPSMPDPFGGGGFAPQPSAGGWLDRTVRIADGRVLLTPPEAEAIYCLDHATGEPLWQQPRGEHLFVAAADGERVLLIGRSGMTLLKASDGSSVASVPFPAGTTPTGRGYVAADSYVQPLSDGSLLRINRSSGSTDAPAQSSRGIVAGNLIWHDGVMYSVGPDYLRAFDDRRRLTDEIAERLASNPNDATALLRRADLLAESGRYAEAIEHCRRAYAADPSPETKNRLIAALLDGIRHAEPEAEKYDTELERLAGP